jgi:glycine cleavage system H protein
MSSIPSDLRYTNDHEWVRPTEHRWAVGITAFAVEQLGDITLVELPAEGDLVTRGQRFGTIESVKSVSDLFAPVSGRIVRVNDALKAAPERVNDDCYAAWMVEVEPSDTTEIEELLTPDAYAELTKG